VSDRIVGIDLGTTNSAVAFVRDGSPKLMPCDGRTIVPSVVGVGPTGEILIGVPARNQWVVAPESTVRSIKRRMGRDETVTMADKEYRPQEISAFILRRLREAAALEIGEGVVRAVITVPAYFTELQRQATIEAGEIAGLSVARIINEPTAAALAYGLGREDEQTLLVYDLGGGTFDVSVVDTGAGVVDIRATCGDNNLGGDDFDELLANQLATEFEAEHGVDVRTNVLAWTRLLRAAEETKIALSSEPFATVRLEYLAESNGAALHLEREVSREEFEALILESVERTLQLLDSALADAEIGVDDVDIVLLVGGSTKIPLVAAMIAEHVGRVPHSEIDPDAVVALGAAVQAAIVAGEPVDAVLVDVTPMSLGIETAYQGFNGDLVADQYEPLILRNTSIPTSYAHAFRTVFPDQDTIHVKVFQGENPIASQNVALGDFRVDNLKPNTDTGHTRVTIRFSLDVNGILDVAVEERGTSNRTSVRLTATRQRMSPAEIEASRDLLDGADFEGPEELAEHESRHVDPGVLALIERASEAMVRPDIDPGLASKLADLQREINMSARNDDDTATELLCDELIDLLIEAEG